MTTETLPPGGPWDPLPILANRTDSLSTPRRTIAFIGASGVGKSSLINAMLGDRILPTSGLRACTLTPFEVSYHAEDSVKAVVEYISTECWLEEIRPLISALRDARGFISRLSGGSKQVFHKVASVYPLLSARKIMAMSAEEVFASDASFAGRFGSSFVIEASPGMLDGSLRAHCRGVHGALLWPIIKRISLKCNAKVLGDGLTLLDLPGVTLSHTSLGATYPGAEYLKKCDHIFVVSPVQRVGMDNAVRALLRELMESGFLGDGRKNYITFVATCIDDVYCAEIATQLDLQSNAEWRTLTARLRVLEETLGLVKDIDKARDLQHDINSGAFDPRPGPVLSLKRTADAIALAESKRQRTDSGDNVGNVASCTVSVVQRLPPHIVVTSASVSGSRSDVIDKENSIAALQATIWELKMELARLCITARNIWTRQGQFRRDLLEIGVDDGDIPEQIDVFTVSARECLRLQGRQGGADAVFRTVDETGVPELAKFCHHLAQKGKSSGPITERLKNTSLETA